MRRGVARNSRVGPVERLSRAIGTLPREAQAALATVADRADLRLVSGSWHDRGGGCLVANVVQALGADERARWVGAADSATMDMRILGLIPELSSRDLNRLIVAWDEAAAQAEADDDPALRGLLRDALHAAETAVPIGV